MLKRKNHIIEKTPDSPPPRWTLSGENLSEIEAGVLVIGAAKPFHHHGALGYLNISLDLILERLGRNFQGNRGERILLNTQGRWKAHWIFIYGLGELDTLTKEILQEELEGVARDLERLQLGKVVFLLPGYDPHKWGSPEEAVRLLVETSPRGGVIAHTNKEILARIQQVLAKIPLPPEPAPSPEEAPPEPESEEKPGTKITEEETPILLEEPPPEALLPQEEYSLPIIHPAEEGTPEEILPCAPVPEETEIPPPQEETTKSPMEPEPPPTTEPPPPQPQASQEEVQEIKLPPLPKAKPKIQKPPKAILLDPWSPLKFKILDRYIMGEVLSSFTMGISIFILLLFLGRMADLLGFLRGGSPLLIFNFVLAIILATLSMAIPPAFFFGTIMAVSRFSSDSELIAMESLGLSLKRIATPIIILGSITTLLTVFLALYITPLANQALQGTIFRMVTSSPKMGLKEGEFIRLSHGVWVYSAHVKGKRLKGIFLYDERKGMIKFVAAREGKLKVEQENMGITLLLKKGEILSVKGNDFHLLTFNRYGFLLSELAFSLEGGTKKELTLPQLLKRLEMDKRRGRRRYLGTLNHFYKRFSLPFSTLVFALLALSLGTFLPRAEKWTGILVAFGTFLLYYVLLTLSQNMAMKGLLPPFLGAWAPDIILAATGGVLLWMKSERVGL